MAKYYGAKSDSPFEETPLIRNNITDMLMMVVHLLNLMERSKDICSLKEVRDSLCRDENFFVNLYNKCHQAVVYDDTKEMGLGAYPIVFDTIDYDVLSYFDRSTTGINADIVVCVLKYKTEENGKVEQCCDKWIQIDFPDNDNESIIRPVRKP